MMYVEHFVKPLLVQHVKLLVQYSSYFLLELPLKIHTEHLLESFSMICLVENLVLFARVEHSVEAPNVTHLVMYSIVQQSVVFPIVQH